MFHPHALVPSCPHARSGLWARVLGSGWPSLLCSPCPYPRALLLSFPFSHQPLTHQGLVRAQV